MCALAAPWPPVSYWLHSWLVFCFVCACLLLVFCFVCACLLLLFSVGSCSFLSVLLPGSWYSTMSHERDCDLKQWLGSAKNKTFHQVIWQLATVENLRPMTN
jgi:hypothetical protein